MCKNNEFKFILLTVIAAGRIDNGNPMYRHQSSGF